jgi:hypothetical protein
VLLRIRNTLTKIYSKGQLLQTLTTDTIAVETLQYRHKSTTRPWENVNDLDHLQCKVLTQRECYGYQP